MCTNMVSAALQNRVLRHPAVERWLEMPPRFEAGGGGRVALALANLSLSKRERKEHREMREMRELSLFPKREREEVSLLKTTKSSESWERRAPMGTIAPHSARFAVRR